MGPRPVALLASRADRCAAPAYACAVFGCGNTHVLLPATWLARRADAAAVIGSALLSKATGGLLHWAIV